MLKDLIEGNRMITQMFLYPIEVYLSQTLDQFNINYMIKLTDDNRLQIVFTNESGKKKEINYDLIDMKDMPAFSKELDKFIENAVHELA